MERLIVGVLCFIGFCLIMGMGWSILSAIEDLTKQVKQLVNILNVKEKMEKLELDMNQIKDLISRGGGESPPLPPPKPEPEDD